MILLHKREKFPRVLSATKHLAFKMALRCWPFRVASVSPWASFATSCVIFINQGNSGVALS
jgi:hypothetical protein